MVCLKFDSYANQFDPYKLSQTEFDSLKILVKFISIDTNTFLIQSQLSRTLQLHQIFGFGENAIENFCMDFP